MLAVANHHLVKVSFLVSLDTDCMKTRNKNKRSVLHYSAASINTEIASVLLKASKSSYKLSLISSPGSDGMTNFNLSCSKGHLESSKWLFDGYKNCMSEYDPLLHTIQNKDGNTPLMLAVANHHLVNVSLLVSLDTDCMKTRNKNKRSVLHYSAASINTAIASVLLKASKSSDKFSLISSPGSDGMTIFNLSCSKGHLESSKWLFDGYKNCMSEYDPRLRFKIRMETRLLCWLWRIIIL